MRLRRAQRGNGLAYGVLATALMILVVGALYDVYAAYHYRTWGYQAAGEAALAKGISLVVVDRGGFLYHGRVQEVVEAAVAAGLKISEKAKTEVTK